MKRLALLLAVGGLGFAHAPAALAADGLVAADGSTTVKTLVDPLTFESFTVITGGYSISADGTTITGTLPPSTASVDGAVETDPLDPGFAKRFKKARNRKQLRLFDPTKAVRQSTRFDLDNESGCVHNNMTGDFYSPHIYFKGWMIDCGYGTLNMNVWAKYFNRDTGNESDTSPRAYYGTQVCRKTRSCDGASHYVSAPSFESGARDMISRTHGWRTGGGDDTTWTWAAYNR